MNAKIFVTGGTGGLGSHTVPLLRAAGYDLRILSRSAREDTEGVEYVTGDLLAGENGANIDEALDGIETVLHLAGAQKGDDIATRNLAQAAARAGVRHIVYISVIGADKVPVGWLRMKAAAEKAIEESGVPYTILRAAQFHDLTLKAVRTMAKLPVVPNPGGLRFQPVDARDVAARLVELVAGPPAGLVPDIAGPEVIAMGDLVRSYVKAAGKHRMLMPVRIPGKAGKAYRAGDNLTLDGALVASGSWTDFLAAHVG
ncbi:NmrA family protein [Catenulispora acidiphila DSM 44928]|uniref:NmrA family protein n=1 Tax=Catenulispora acidiphila (strain DSM 44928 / JCM 14897 / NBRC 102108 / NRRL B-24433 / ID139908) TaxID=479433 RepID=C7Q0K0_CATAD|nr:NAD(P)H-binding protein [Catenulispora acidiphila]ACU77533.1 NmrA family protein [Catenulispora acidiphila DSM 44928]